MRWSRSVLLVAALASAPAAAPAQHLDSLAARFAAMTAVTGYEDAMADTLRALLPGARADRAGNVVWSRGNGDPVRVAVCPLDEVGYVVGGVTAEGYLTLRRVGQTPMGPLFDQFLEGQRVTVFGRRGAVAGVVAVRSTHLQRGRAAGPDDPFSLDGAFVDVGAASRAGALALGIETLSPVARAKQPHRYGDGLLAAPFAAQRAACGALAAAVQRLAAEPPGRGTMVAVFARRRHFGHDGASFALYDLARGPGAGAPTVVLLGGAGPADSLGAGAVTQAPDSIAVPGGAVPASAWSLPTRYARSPVETIALRDAAALVERLVGFLGGAR